MRKQGIQVEALARNLIDNRAKLIKICQALDKDTRDWSDGEGKGTRNLRDMTWLCGVPMSEVAELLGDIKKK